MGKVPPRIKVPALHQVYGRSGFVVACFRPPKRSSMLYEHMLPTLPSGRGDGLRRQEVLCAVQVQRPFA